MLNNCPYKPLERSCRLEIDYIVLQETQETCRQLLNENRYLWNRLDRIEAILEEHGILVVLGECEIMSVNSSIW